MISSIGAMPGGNEQERGDDTSISSFCQDKVSISLSQASSLQVKVSNVHDLTFTLQRLTRHRYVIRQRGVVAVVIVDQVDG
jgi:glutathione peroxidase-family protein